MQEELLTEMSNLQHDVERARSRATQLAQDSATWAEGYKQGRSDMIRAMAALHGELAMSQDPPDETISMK